MLVVCKQRLQGKGGWDRVHLIIVEFVRIDKNTWGVVCGDFRTSDPATNIAAYHQRLEAQGKNWTCARH